MLSFESPVISVQDVTGDLFGPAGLTGILLFDDAPVARFRLHDTQHLSLQALDPANDLVSPVFATLRRITESARVIDGKIHANPAIIIRSATQAYGLTRIAYLLKSDLSDLPATPFYVLADQANFADGAAITETMIVPCDGLDMAVRARAGLRSAAIQDSWDWEGPRFGNVRVLTQTPPRAPIGGSIIYSIVPTGAGSWLWAERPLIPPPDKALETRVQYVNQREVVVGEFDVPDGQLIVMDPGYNLSESHVERYLTIRPGRYRATVRMQEAMVFGPFSGYRDADRVSGVMLQHIAEPPGAVDLDTTVLSVPVDTGRVAFGSATDLPIEFGSDDPPEELTILRERGFVTTSGSGDGCYSVSIARNAAGQIVTLALPFIMEAFAPTYRQREGPTIEPDESDLAPLGVAASYLHTFTDWRRRYRTPIVDTVEEFVGILRAGSGLPEPRRAEIEATLQAAEVSQSQSDRRGAEVLRMLIVEIQSTATPQLPLQ